GAGHLPPAVVRDVAQKILAEDLRRMPVPGEPASHLLTHTCLEEVPRHCRHEVILHIDPMPDQPLIVPDRRGEVSGLIQYRVRNMAGQSAQPPEQTCDDLLISKSRKQQPGELPELPAV